MIVYYKYIYLIIKKFTVPILMQISSLAWALILIQPNATVVMEYLGMEMNSSSMAMLGRLE